MYELRGKKIKNVRLMTEEEIVEQGWLPSETECVTLVLEDGQLIYPQPARNADGAKSGSLLGFDGFGRFRITPRSVLEREKYAER